jgi:predicted amidophosphoribosyltransferase
VSSEHCQCPGPHNTIAPQGYCPRCGTPGSRHAQAIRQALAARNPRPALAAARYAGWQAGYGAGLAEGRRQTLDALFNPGILPAPAPIGTTGPYSADPQALEAVA